MNLLRILTLASVALLTACGGGGGGGGGGNTNQTPTAAFTASCNDLSCTFTDRSSDPDGHVQTVAWDFGDAASGSNSASGAPGSTATHAFSAAGTYSVKVTATDDAGVAGTTTEQVAVTAPPVAGPTAAFSVSCSALVCAITNTSTVNGAATWAWTFGNGQTSTAQNPVTVTYSATTPTKFTLTLAVTSGGLTSQATQQVVVAPGATLNCNGSNCALGIDQKATVIVTLVSRNCGAHGNTFVITQPVVETLFTDGCYATVGTSFPLNSGAAYSAGTQLAAEVRSGVVGATNPQLRVTGDFANGWSLVFDDGFLGPGEPDFNDLVITVKATPAP